MINGSDLEAFGYYEEADRQRAADARATARARAAAPAPRYGLGFGFARAPMRAFTARAASRLFDADE